MASTEQPPMDRDVRLLLQFVTGRDWPCPTCRYNLRDLTRPVCPECGCELRLQVGTVTPRVGLLFLAMSPLAIVAGFGAILIPGALLGGFPSAWGFYVVLSLAVVDLVACVVLYRMRHLFLRCGRRAQAAIVLLLWVSHGLAVSIAIIFGG